MKDKFKVINKSSRGKLLYKSRTPRKVKTIIIYFIIDSLLFIGFGSMLYLFIIALIYKQFLEFILLIIYSITGIILSGILSSMFFYLILCEFFTYFFLYEHGIEIRKTTFYPLKIKRHFISYDQITDVNVLKGPFNLKTLYIYLKDRDPYKLTEYHIDNLEEAKEHYLKYKEEYKKIHFKM